MLKVTLRGVMSHALRLLLTVVAVVLSVAFMSGTQVLTATISTSFDKVFDDVYKNLDVVVRSADEVDTGFGPTRGLISDSVIPKIQRVDGVDAVEGQVRGILTILDKNGEPLGNNNAGPPTFGLNWLTEPALNGWHLNTGVPPTGERDVVLDQKTADKAGYKVGDQVEIALNKGRQTYTVVGTGGFGNTQDYAGSAAVLFETKAAQAALGDAGKFTWINVGGEDGVTQDELRTRVAGVLPPDAQAITGKAFTAESQDVFRKFFGFLGTILLVFGIVALFVGSFIIYNTFSIIVAQSTRELALLRAMGASRAQVIVGVVSEALLVGAFASLLGLVGGVLLATGLTNLLSSSGFGPNVESLTLPPVAFISSFLVGTTVTLVSGLLPALKAARVPPVAAMLEVSVDHSSRSRPRLIGGSVLFVLGAVLLYLGLFTKGSNALAKVGASFLLLFLAVTILGPLFARPLSAAIGSPLRKVTGRLARNNAMRNPRRTSTTASALMIGVGLIVLFAILVQSIKVSATQAIDSAFTGDLVIDSGSFGQTGLDPSLAERVAKVPGVAAATGLRIGFVQTDGNATTVVGVDPAALQQALEIDVVAGDLTGLTPDQVAITKQQADADHRSVGQKIAVKFIDGGLQLLTVGAIYKIDAPQQGGLLMTHEGFAKRFPPSLNLDNTIYVKLAPGADVAAVKAELKRMVKRDFPTASVLDLTEYKESQVGFLNILLLIITVMLVLAVIIALLGIFNTLLLSIYERTREIGLLRAVGGSRAQVRTSIRWEAVIFSLQGTLIGMVIGFAFAWVLVRSITEDTPLTFAVPTGQLLAMIVFALLAGLAAAVIPAWRASKLDILKAIATE